VKNALTEEPPLEEYEVNLTYFFVACPQELSHNYDRDRSKVGTPTHAIKCEKEQNALV